MAKAKLWYIATARVHEDNILKDSSFIKAKRKATIIEAVDSWWVDSWWKPRWHPQIDALYLVSGDKVLWEIPVPPEVLDELQNKA